VRADHRRVADAPALGRLGQRPLDRRALALRDAHRLLGDRELEPALGGPQHRLLLGGVPLELRGLGGQLELAGLRAPLAAPQRLPRGDGDAGARSVDRGAEGDAVGRAERGRREPGAVDRGLRAADARTRRQADLRRPQRGRLRGAGRARAAGGAGRVELGVVAARGAPRIDEALGTDGRRGRQRERCRDRQPSRPGVTGV
jgi:hypothetical protein